MGGVGGGVGGFAATGRSSSFNPDSFDIGFVQLLVLVNA